MSLAGRVTTFFLAALALVLAGFSVTLYLLADAYLNRQADERLDSALHLLTAAAEVKPNGVEWEPEERVLNLGQDDDEDQVRWTVHNDRGRLLGRSRNLGADTLIEINGPENAGVQREPLPLHIERHGQPWRMRQVLLEPSASQPGTVSDPDDEPKHAALILTAGVSLQPIYNTLRTLALTLSGLSLGLWVLAAIVGRWLCRRALIPLSRMAATAQAMNATTLGQRLPEPGTRDELEDLGRAFNGLFARLEEAFERQRRFTGDASHQLRTPLTAVLGQVEVALHRERTAEEYQQTLRSVHRQGVRLRQIVESLLFLARAEAEAGLPNLDAVDLTAWIQEYWQTWSGHARRPDLRLDSPAEPLWVRVHASLLGQLLDNLLDNACKCSEPGTPITLHLRREPGVVMIAVDDAGCGIAPADLPHVFQPFYRSTHTNGRGGVGLGLAVAQRIVAAFKGTIHAESEAGRGSTFVVRLPELVPAPPEPSCDKEGLMSYTENQAIA